MLDLDADITGLRGADYNPRKIEPEDLERLGQSIRALGLVKPLIVRNDLLVAGHQRTKALRALGITRAAVFRLGRDTTAYDEIRFNQLHNGTDMDFGDEAAHVPGGMPADAVGRFTLVAPELIAGNMRSSGAVVRAEIAEMIVKYGPWGGVVATASGRVIHAAQYALAAKATRTPLTVFTIPDAREGEYRAFLDKTYGLFNYDHLKRQTYIQSLAQLFRLREGTTERSAGGSLKSGLYEGHVLPWLATQDRATLRGLDFGSGQGDYAARLRKGGWRYRDVELFRRKGGAKSLDMAAIHGMIDLLCSELRTRGRFDVVVCDSVMNSVDSARAERAVVTTLNAMCRLGGRVFISGLLRDKFDQRRSTTSAQFAAARGRIAFLDENGFSALFRSGQWFYQKYHTRPETIDLVESCGLKVVGEQFTGDVWRLVCEKIADLPSEAVDGAIDFEFDLPISDTLRLGRHEDVKDALRQAHDGPLHGADTGAAG